MARSPKNTASHGRRPRHAATGSVALAAAATLAFNALPAAAARAGTPVAVTVSTAAAGRVGSGFAGFSYEKDRIGAGLFNPGDSALVKLFRLLGPSVLRVGGNLDDIVRWNPAGAGGSATEIAPADVTEFAAFVRATGWKAIYGINLKSNTPADAASEAQFAARALGGNLLAFEIGNEPNEYQTESAYQTAYNTYADAIRAKVPGAVFDGPGEGDSTSWANTFAAAEKNNGLSILSTHEYIGSNTTGTISGMLASNTSGRLPNAEAAMQSARSANGIPQWRMTEANSYYHGGTLGVSNVEAASLWSLDFMDGIASHGGVGVNFHGGTSTQFPLNYSPIAISGLTPTGVQGVYYGELLWKLAGTGTLHAAAVSGATASGATGVTAWGIGDNVIVDNKGTGAITATVTLPARAGAAVEYLLTAPSLSSTAITIAGSSVSGTAAFHPAPRSLSVSGKKIVLDIPAGSAALIVTSAASAATTTGH